MQSSVKILIIGAMVLLLASVVWAACCNVNKTTECCDAALCCEIDGVCPCDECVCTDAATCVCECTDANCDTCACCDANCCGETPCTADCTCACKCCTVEVEVNKCATACRK